MRAQARGEPERGEWDHYVEHYLAANPDVRKAAERANQNFAPAAQRSQRKWLSNQAPEACYASMAASVPH
jgi:hypothetical protein